MKTNLLLGTETAPLLEVRGLTRHFALRGHGLFGRQKSLRAVDGVSFDIRAGETLSLVGESGCGKTTTGRLVLGMERATSGSVHYAGRAVSDSGGRAWRALRRELQMVYQDPLGALDPRMNIARQVAEPLDIHDIGPRQGRSASALAMLKAVGLGAELSERYPHELSGGQQQRVVIARALIVEPRLVVCDEPVSALDVSVQAQVVNLLARLQRERGLAYLFISHDLKVVRHISHRVAVMYLGQIVELAPRDVLFTRPLHPYTQALIAAVPVPDPALREQRGRRRTVMGDPPSPIAPPPGCRFHTRCPMAVDICRRDVPPLVEHLPGHRVACHFADASAAANGEAG